LEIEGAGGLANQLPGLESFMDRELKVHDRVTLKGYPWNSPQLLVDDRGVVVMPRSDRHLIPLLSSMAELGTGPAGEFGMSGGPAFERGTDKVAGLLSHQYIELVPGKPSKVAHYVPGQKVLQNHLLLIPASEIKKWLDA